MPKRRVKTVVVRFKYTEESVLPDGRRSSRMALPEIHFDTDEYKGNENEPDAFWISKAKKHFFKLNPDSDVVLKEPQVEFIYKTLKE